MHKKTTLSVITLLIYSCCFGQPGVLHGFKWDTTGAGLPVTHLRFRDDSSLVQFAILSDRTGGMNPGVYEDAIGKTNLLHPQFVMSVGDLINGYSTDRELVGRQWEEFNNIIQPLQTPFFYVPGNHDISNRWMQQEWIRRYGRTYYSFVYNNTLFLCLNSQDGGEYGMTKAQVAYFLDILKQHADVKWTFLFMHQPLWANSKAETGFEKLENALQNRNYTVFAAHTHNYLLSHRNNRKYFILATTGGGTENRGPKFGEFNHLTWVTMDRSEPQIINIALEGLVKEDVVDEKIKAMIQPLTRGSWLKVIPAFSNRVKTAALPASLVIKNPGQDTLSVSGLLTSVQPIQFEPREIKRYVPPGTEQTVPLLIRATNTDSLDLAKLSPVEIKLDGAYFLEQNEYKLPASQRLLFDWPRSVEILQTPASLPALNDTGRFIAVPFPEHVEEAWDWHGMQDGGIFFSVARDLNHLYLSAVISDDHFVFQSSPFRDKILVYLEDKNGKQVCITILPDTTKSTFTIADLDGNQLTRQVTCTTAISGMHLRLLLRLPLTDIVKEKGTVRMNIAYNDQDDPTSLENAIIYWKPLWQSAMDYKNSGTFLIY